MTKTKHPFFCNKKNCRKTAWDTPEYMSEEDWAFLERAYDIMLKKDYTAFLWLGFENPDMWRNLFNHMLGWPEGMVYCREIEYLKKTFLVGNFRHLGIEKALFAHKGIEHVKYLITLQDDSTHEVEWDSHCNVFYISPKKYYSPSALKEIKLLTKFPKLTNVTKV